MRIRAAHRGHRQPDRNIRDPNRATPSAITAQSIHVMIRAPHSRARRRHSTYRKRLLLSRAWQKAASARASGDGESAGFAAAGLVARALEADPPFGAVGGGAAGNRRKVSVATP